MIDDEHFLCPYIKRGSVRSLGQLIMLTWIILIVKAIKNQDEIPNYWRKLPS